MPLRKLNEGELRFVLESAIRAPSADNRLPIRFRVDEDAIEIRAAEELPTAGGYRELLLLLTLGALVENAHIAASTLNHRLTVTLPQRLEAGMPLLRLTPVDGPVAADPLHTQLEQRHTNRRVVYRGPPLSTAERKAIAQSTERTPAARITWIEGASRRFVIRQMTHAETERFRNRVLHAELFSAIRFDVGWNAGCPEGLPPGALQVEAPARPLFQAFRHWSIARAGNRFGAHHIFGLRSCRLPCMLAPDLGVVTVDRRDIESLVQAGRCFQRIWLELTQLGRVLQPLPAAALYALPEARGEGVPERLHQRLEGAWQQEFDGQTPVMFFRSGKAKPAQITTGRLPVEVYLDGSSPTVMKLPLQAKPLA